MRSLGFHNRADDSVNSFTVKDSEMGATITDLMRIPNIDRMWTRDGNGNVDWQWERMSVTVSITRERITLTDFPYSGWVTRTHTH